jgi:hypothetical protein
VEYTTRESSPSAAQNPVDVRNVPLAQLPGDTEIMGLVSEFVAIIEGPLGGPAKFNSAI